MRIPLIAVLLVPAVVLRAAEPTPEQADFFEKKIRPLFAESCYKCHSSTSEKLKGGLLMDSREGLLKGGETGPAIVPGDPDTSLLIKAVRYEDPDLQMPPKHRLSEAQVADLCVWVKTGAVWPGGGAAPVATKPVFDLQKRLAEHWAWKPVVAQTPPTVKNTDWASTPVDQFILAKLEAEGLTPAPQADKRALIRRASFDLTGLPPTPGEIDTFLKDEKPDAFAKVVDRLLASPQFGERWARHWFDLVRYAESMGNELDIKIPNAWRYRDYVIRAINSDVPYNQLVLEHIAGDLLPKPRTNPADGTNESVIGTGFFWFTPQMHAPRDVRDHEAEFVDNQIDTLGKAFQGMTLACARCHEHKFDAISTKDYYALVGVLQSSRYSQRAVDNPEILDAKKEELLRLKKEIRTTTGEIWEREAGTIAKYLLAERELSAKQEPEPAAADVAEKAGVDSELLERWDKALHEKEVKSPAHPLYAWANAGGEEDAKLPARWETLVSKLKKENEEAAKPAKDYAPFPAFDKWFHDGPALAGGKSVRGDFMVGTAAQPVAGLARGGAMHSGLVSRRLQGLLHSPSFVIEKRYLHVRAAGQDARVHLILENFHIIDSELYAGLKKELKNDDARWLTFDLKSWLGRRAYLELMDLTEADPGDHNTYGKDGWLTVDNILFSDQEKPPEHEASTSLALLGDVEVETAKALAERYQKAVANAVDAWENETANEAQVALLDWLARNHLFDAKTGDLVVAQVEEFQNTVATIPDPTFVVAMTEGTGIDEHVSIRGNYKTPGDLVPRRFMEAVSGAKQPPVAHGSGRWEVAQRLLAADNPLTARVAVNNAWNHLFGRGIVPTPDNFGVLGEKPTHPELLDYLATWYRDNGWSEKKLIRSLMLTRTYQMSSKPADKIAETKDPTDALLHRARVRRLESEAIRDAVLAVSGRLDKKMFGPAIPVHQTPFMGGRGKPKDDGPLDGAGRRSIYTAVTRNYLSPMMLAFDAPIPASTVAKRTSSNVPAQALILMNDPFVVQQAQFWAKRVLSQEGTTAERIARIYLEAFGRPPTDTETRDAQEFIEQQGRTYTTVALNPGDEEKVWSDLCHVIFNVKEFIFIN